MFSPRYTFAGTNGQSADNVNTSRSNDNEETIAMLEKMIKALQMEIDNIKRSL